MENSNRLSTSTKAKEHTPRQPRVWSVLTPQPRPLPPSQVTFLWPCSGSRPAPQPGRGHSTPPICSTHSSAPYCWYLLYWKKWRASELCTVTQSCLKRIISAQAPSQQTLTLRSQLDSVKDTHLVVGVYGRVRGVRMRVWGKGVIQHRETFPNSKPR